MLLPFFSGKFQLTTSPNLSRYQSDGGNIFTRGFCPECGASMFGKSNGLPHRAMLTAGSLDDSSQFRPAMDYYVSSAQPWDHINPALLKFPKLPV